MSINESRRINTRGIYSTVSHKSTYSCVETLNFHHRPIIVEWPHHGNWRTLFYLHHPWLIRYENFQLKKLELVFFISKFIQFLFIFKPVLWRFGAFYARFKVFCNHFWTFWWNVFSCQFMYILTQLWKKCDKSWLTCLFMSLIYSRR